MTFKLLTILVMSGLYTLIGLKHIFDPKYFLPMIPPLFPFKKTIVYITGALEIILDKYSREIDEAMILIEDETDLIGSH